MDTNTQFPESVPFTLALHPSGRRFEPVNIACAAKNYALHAKEMSSEPPAEPVFFLKPRSSLVGDGAIVPWPAHSRLIHHEVELAVIIGASGKNVQESRAPELVAGLAVAVDLTARDVQAAAKKASLPWFASKGFDGSCPMSAPIDAVSAPAWDTIELSLAVNGRIVQRGSTKDMIHKIPAMIAHLSRIITLRAGDIILTGTPEGVGEIAPDDWVEAIAEGVGSVRFRMGRLVRGGGLEPPRF